MQQAEIRACVRPLLEMRSDLVLVGRMLVTRPFRHVLRGIYLAQSRWDKNSVYLHKLAAPLLAQNHPIGWSDRLFDGVWHADRSYFPPVLIDCLAHDVFGPLGASMSLGDFPQSRDEAYQLRPERLKALILAGATSTAEALVERRSIQWREYPQTLRLIDEARTLLNRDPLSIASECHQHEEITVKKLKIDRYWEQAPFPIEVPSSERAALASEAVFSIAPWPELPPGVIEKPPVHPNQIVFASNEFIRDAELKLLSPMSEEDAMSEYLAGGSIVTTYRDDSGTLWLSKFHHKQSVIIFNFRGNSRVTIILLRDDSRDGFYRVSSVEMRGDEFAELWNLFIDSQKGVQKLRRAGMQGMSESPLNPADGDFRTELLPNRIAAGVKDWLQQVMQRQALDWPD
jgi:hypothetical protein